MQDADNRFEKTGTVDGKTIKLGNREFVVPPLNLKAIKKYQNQLLTLNAADMSQVTLLAEVVHTALLRNYANLELDDVEELLDTANLVPVIEAVMNTSLLLARVPGEVQAGASQSPGQSSTVS